REPLKTSNVPAWRAARGLACGPVPRHQAWALQPMSINGLSARLFIGVDGGGTSCRARIEDEDGRYLGSGVAGAASTRLGIENSLAAVTKASLAAAHD